MKKELRIDIKIFEDILKYRIFSSKSTLTFSCYKIIKYLDSDITELKILNKIYKIPKIVYDSNKEIYYLSKPIIIKNTLYQQNKNTNKEKVYCFESKSFEEIREEIKNKFLSENWCISNEFELITP